MDCMSGTDQPSLQEYSFQDNLLLDLVKEVCSDQGSITPTLGGKVKRLISDCDLKHYSGLHKLSATDESASTVLGLINSISSDLTFDEQAELNSAIIQKIQEKLPKFTAELQKLSNEGNEVKSKDVMVKDLQQSIDDKLKTLEEQENEKMELMIEWLNFRLLDVVKYSSNSSHVLTLKTKILELKSKILHLQILQNIFTETNQSIKAYSEVHKDLKDSLNETEQQIKNYRKILESDG